VRSCVGCCFYYAGACVRADGRCENFEYYRPIKPQEGK
jgi:hypothetical protein